MANSTKKNKRNLSDFDSKDENIQTDFPRYSYRIFGGHSSIQPILLFNIKSHHQHQINIDLELRAIVVKTTNKPLLYLHFIS